MVRSSDIYVLSGLLLVEGDAWTHRSLADRLEVPPALVQRTLSRAEEAGLYSPSRRAVQRAHFEELAVHALRFLAPAGLGSLTPGVPAAWAAEPMASQIVTSKEELVPVWPDAHGAVRGQALEPLHPSAVEAARGWPQLAELLAVLDSLRAGDPRVRKTATRLLARTLQGRPKAARR